jgi:ArsR family transcriptional regulator, arsenate/arsenite/antimonite-responsive transcriptional repressor
MVGTSHVPAREADRLVAHDRVELLRAVADPTRLAVLDSLAADGARCHCDLEVELGIPANRLSFHLRVLRDAGLVRANRLGRRVRYCIDPTALAALREALPAADPTGDIDPSCTACEREGAEVAR